MNYFLTLFVTLVLFSYRSEATNRTNEKQAFYTFTETEQLLFEAKPLSEHFGQGVRAVKAVTTIISKMPSKDKFNRQRALLAFVSKPSKFSKHLKLATAGIKLLTSFLNLGQIPDLINIKFLEVNQKLAALDSKLDSMELSIKSNVALNVFFSKWMTWMDVTENGYKKLMEIQAAMQTEKTNIRKLKLAEEFVKYYEDNQLEGTVDNIYKMAVLQETKVTRNIFDRFIEEDGCDVTVLAQLMVRMYIMMNKAATQKLSYYVFKGEDKRAEDAFRDIQTKLYDVRRQFDLRAWKCQRDCIMYAKEDVGKILITESGKKDGDIVRMIFNVFETRYPWFSWAVASIKRDETLMAWRGETYFTKDSGEKRRILVAFQDSSLDLSCAQMNGLDMLLTFKPCDGCNHEFFVASSNFLLSSSCGVPGLKDLKLQLPDRQLALWFYVGSMSNSQLGKCAISNQCNGHGMRKIVRFTSKVQCLCAHFWEGANCQVNASKDLDETIADMISNLRLNFGKVNRVPSVVDIYFSIQNLTHNLQMLFNEIKANFDHTKNIIKHNDIIFKAQNVVHMYSDLNHGVLDFSQFGHKLDLYLTSVTNQFELQHGIENMILARGILDTNGNDIFNTFKRDYQAKYRNSACRQSYNNAVTAFKMSLSTLDLALGEALLLHKKWKFYEASSPVEKEKVLKETTYLGQILKPRQAKYSSYWTRQSCGSIEIPRSGIKCSDQLTYSGLNISNILCEEGRIARPSTLHCESQSRSGGDSALAWTAKPECVIKYEWRPWGSWEGCSVTCGSGMQQRRRDCHNNNDVSLCRQYAGGIDYQQRPCVTKDCCSSRFRCLSSNKCISRSWLCDGDNDCGNFEDERSCSNHVKDDDTIAIKSVATSNRWIGCWYGPCKLHSCPGSWMSEWDHCTGEVFRIERETRRTGRSIHDGDRISLLYPLTGEYLNCNGGCYRRKYDSTADLWIHSSRNDGGPIKPRDQVAFRSKSHNAWLSYGSSCPQSSFTAQMAAHCPEAIWQIAVKR